MGKKYLIFFMFLSAVLMGCQKSRPLYLDQLTSHLDVLDSIEYDLDKNHLFYVRTSPVRYDEESPERLCSRYVYAFRGDSVVSCSKINGERLDFDGKDVKDSLFYINAIQHFESWYLQITEATKYTLLYYYNTGARRGTRKMICCFEFFQGQKQFDLICCDSCYRHEVIQECIKVDPHLSVYDLYKNWFVIDYSKKLNELHLEH